MELKGVRSGVGRRRGRGLKAWDPGRRETPGKVLKKRRSPRRRGRMGTGVNRRTRLEQRGLVQAVRLHERAEVLRQVGLGRGDVTALVKLDDAARPRRALRVQVAQEGRLRARISRGRVDAAEQPASASRDSARRARRRGETRGDGRKGAWRGGRGGWGRGGFEETSEGAEDDEGARGPRARRGKKVSSERIWLKKHRRGTRRARDAPAPTSARPPSTRARATDAALHARRAV